MNIIFNDRRDSQRLKEKYHMVKQPYISKALNFKLNTQLAIAIRMDALLMESAELVGNQ